MKLYIDFDLEFEEKYDNLSDEEFSNLEDNVQYYQELMNENCIRHRVEYDRTYFKLIIRTQKCTLPEESVNDFFYNVLTDFWEADVDYKLEYGYIGGKGEDFSLRLSKIWDKQNV